jgi:hypothetical protein
MLCVRLLAPRRGNFQQACLLDRLGIGPISSIGFAAVGRARGAIVGRVPSISRSMPAHSSPCRPIVSHRREHGYVRAVVRQAPRDIPTIASTVGNGPARGTWMGTMLARDSLASACRDVHDPTAALLGG